MTEKAKPIVVHYIQKSKNACGIELTMADEFSLTFNVNKVTCPKCQEKIDDEIDLMAQRSID